MTQLVKKEPVDAVTTSWTQFCSKMVFSSSFIKDLQEMKGDGLANVNDETCELLEVYLKIQNFSPENAKKVSAAGEGLAIWVGAMKRYREVTKIVAPKILMLKEKDEQLAAANVILEEKERGLAVAKAKMDEMEAKRKEANDEADAIKKELQGEQAKSRAAENLINSLKGERDRWELDKDK